jgi:hypothetical protein
MAGKRKHRSTRTDRADLSQPSKWRLQHGSFSPLSYDTDPDTGLVVTHRRAVDTLGLMLAHGSITQEMHDAGQRFRSLFRRAAFDTMATSQLLRVSPAASDGVSTLQIDAQQKIATAIDVLGGHDSPAGSCAWFVVGLEFSVRDWAARQGWAGKPVHGPIGQGILVAALGMLAAHFGLGAGQHAA